MICGKKYHDAADAGDDAVGDQARESSIAQPFKYGRTQSRRRRIDCIHDGRRPCKHGLEHDGHDEKQADRSRDRTIEKSRDGRAPCHVSRRRFLNLVEYLPNPGVSNAGITCDWRLILEQLRPNSFDFRLGRVTELCDDSLVRLRLSVDKQSFQLREAQSLVRIFGQLLGSLCQLRPDANTPRRSNVL